MSVAQINRQLSQMQHQPQMYQVCTTGFLLLWIEMKEVLLPMSLVGAA